MWRREEVAQATLGRGPARPGRLNGPRPQTQWTKEGAGPGGGPPGGQAEGAHPRLSPRWTQSCHLGVWLSLGGASMTWGSKEIPFSNGLCKNEPEIRES